MIILFLLKLYFGSKFEKIDLFCLLLFKGSINLVFLIKQLYVQVVALAVLPYSHLDLFLHLAKDHNCCRLPRTLSIHRQSLHCPQLLTVELQLVL